MSKFRNLVENLNDIKQWLSQSSSIKEGDKKVFDKASGYNSSKDETYIYEKLKEKYPDVIISYTDDRFVNPETNRHFQSDLYIPSKIKCSFWYSCNLYKLKDSHSIGTHKNLSVQKYQKYDLPLDVNYGNLKASSYIFQGLPD